MRVFAYCCASFRDATRNAAGVEPLTCPPTSADTFDVNWLAGHDLLYFDLHGAPGQAYWMGDAGTVALRASQVLEVDLGGAVVFAANCFLADADSPMMDALLYAGARYVIGGDGRNWGPGRGPLYGAPLLGLWLRRWMEKGVSPLRSLTLAKLAVRLRRVASADTLAFRAYERRRDGQEMA